MKLLNIYNKGRKVYLFKRDDNGKQIISTDNTFHPFFYEPDQDGEYKAYDGVSVRKVLVSEPTDVPKMRSKKSYSSDILFTKNYLINKIDKIEKAPIKYFFLDIEVLAKELPTYENPIYPISCVSIYNSMDSKIKTWFLLDYDGTDESKEIKLLSDVVNYFQQETPDLWFSWNVDFDYEYLFTRYFKVFKKSNFAKVLSPIKEIRRSKTDNIFYPAGISIVDYYALFKRVIKGESSYALDKIAQSLLGEKEWGKTNFGELDESVKEKNINDVKRMIKLEKKYALINYYNEVRCLTKCLWEDLYWNSKIIEMLLLEEANNMQIVLPNKPEKDPKKKSETFQGATREAVYTGAMTNIGKYDLTSAYPNMIVNFCLDSQNIGNKGVDVDGIKFVQNDQTLMPKIVKKLLVLKDSLKEELKNTSENDIHYKELKSRYDALKGIVNSAFGVMALEIFRIHDNRVASSIAFLVRDLLLYTRDKIEELGHKVVYWDTDSLFIDSKENLTGILNQYIQDWVLNKYNKKDINIDFEYEGLFLKLFIVTKCRYVGYLEGVEKPEVKGVEMKRSSSSKYEAYFQKELINKMLNQESRYNVEEWIKEEKSRIKTLSVAEIAFPCKIQNKTYKNVPIFVRAYNNTKMFQKDFNVEKGELFHYVFVKPLGHDEKGKIINVVAYNEIVTFLQRKSIDWEEMIRRNIITKSEKIFEAMGWSTDSLHDTGQEKLF